MPRLTELVVARRQLDLLGDMQAYLMIETYEYSGEL
jgi:hypothetical protein